MILNWRQMRKSRPRKTPKNKAHIFLFLWRKSTFIKEISICEGVSLSGTRKERTTFNNSYQWRRNRPKFVTWTLVNNTGLPYISHQKPQTPFPLLAYDSIYVSKFSPPPWVTHHWVSPTRMRVAHDNKLVSFIHLSCVSLTSRAPAREWRG